MIIKLTQVDDEGEAVKDLYVSILHISAFEVTKNKSTLVHIAGSHAFVDETPAEILRLIRVTKADA